MNISLTQVLKSFVNKKVASGLYHSASEVIREGLRLLEDHDAHRQARLKALQADIALGLRQANQGKLMPLDMAQIKVQARKQLTKKLKAA